LDETQPIEVSLCECIVHLHVCQAKCTEKLISWLDGTSATTDGDMISKVGSCI
jgi:hypothetical protein